MADINSESLGVTDLTLGLTETADADEADIIRLVELLFFAYRDFISDPDAILEQHGFGRAHHRVVHFVGRNPGMRVAEILSVLKITKQSFGRVLRDLIDAGFLYQREGASDRRQRLLYLSPSGHDLHRQLMAPQIDRFRKAMAAMRETGVTDDTIFARFLAELVNDDEREKIHRLISGLDGGQIKTNERETAYTDC